MLVFPSCLSAVLLVAALSICRAGYADPGCPFTARFGSFENEHNGAQQSHTFVRYAKNGREFADISFMPVPRAFRATRKGAKVPLTRQVEGFNYSWDSTVQFAQANGLTFFDHGTYCITAFLYERQKLQSQILRSGQVAYKALDRWTRQIVLGPGQAVDCITANSQAIECKFGMFRHRALHGRAATEALIEYFAETEQLFR